MKNRELKFRAWNGEKMIFRAFHDKNWYTESFGGKLVQGAHPDCIDGSEFDDYTNLAEDCEDEIEELIKKTTEI